MARELRDVGEFFDINIVISVYQTVGGDALELFNGFVDVRTSAWCWMGTDGVF